MNCLQFFLITFFDIFQTLMRFFNTSFILLLIFSLTRGRLFELFGRIEHEFEILYLENVAREWNGGMIFVIYSKRQKPNFKIDFMLMI